MKLPRDLSGDDVANLLARRYGYRVSRTKGSHMTVTLSTQDGSHNITVPRHRAIRTGTLNAITTEVAKFLDLPKQEVRKSLFG